MRWEFQFISFHFSMRVQYSSAASKQKPLFFRVKKCSVLGHHADSFMLLSRAEAHSSASKKVSNSSRLKEQAEKCFCNLLLSETLTVGDHADVTVIERL